MVTETEREAIRREVMDEILAENRTRKKEWRAKNKDRVQESNRKYYKKKKAERLGAIEPTDYQKSLSDKFPNCLLMSYKGKYLLRTVLPNEYEVRITGIDSPSDKVTIEIRKGETLVCKCAKVEHSELEDVLNFLGKRVKWL